MLAPQIFGNVCHVLPGLLFLPVKDFFILIRRAKFMFVKYTVQNMAPYLKPQRSMQRRRGSSLSREQAFVDIALDQVYFLAAKSCC